ncbi:HAD-IA family hydrolase [Shewanella sp. VB17]|uniref:HAD-IA family hydrolase n=1 Tax=Shewanella sp. VB17 TaxID=2739432 RepID=UPI0015673371|nr:HAD-IA family hydrolase [Shewanella sp. VB17]NRD75739.1 HAD-IA family hydrolase [Shewanella sp. VB17]
MRCYINPSNIDAISFDLDDTLYNNLPIIQKAEDELVHFLHQEYPLTARLKKSDWSDLKKALFRAQPELCHDTGLARKTVLSRGLHQLGYSIKEAETGAQDGLNCFLRHRSDFAISSPVLSLLQILGQKWPLVGLTNGNADADRIGLGPLFEFVLSPGLGVRMKPAPDMFNIAINRLGISAHRLLHVGDSHCADVMGARLAGCQSVWLNPAFGAEDMGQAKGSLPHLEISRIEDLMLLI